MKPYYTDEFVTLYHGDCREIIADLEAGLVLSDPPYGIAYNREDVPQGKHLPARRGQVASVHGDAEPFDPSHLLRFKRLILWGANCYATRLPDPAIWICWDKVTRNGLNLRIGEAEFAWTNCVGRTRVFRHLWSGGYRAIGLDRGEYVHPTQKPIALMRWCIEIADASGTVLDPYCGSGTTLIAAKNLGRESIGIEIEERYCEIAAKRLAQGVLWSANG